jgi:hypothetical protein
LDDWCVIDFTEPRVKLYRSEVTETWFATGRAVIPCFPNLINLGFPISSTFAFRSWSRVRATFLWDLLTVRFWFPEGLQHSGRPVSWSALLFNCLVSSCSSLRRYTLSPFFWRLTRNQLAKRRPTETSEPATKTWGVSAAACARPSEIRSERFINVRLI